jgi:hypothetical protein
MMHASARKPGRNQTAAGPDALRAATATDPKSSLDGLWVLLEGEADAGPIDDRIPVMARAGAGDTYLLGFKNMAKARQFMTVQALAACEPRMVVRGNRDRLRDLARDAGATGVLVDYDPTTQSYGSASELY